MLLADGGDDGSLRWWAAALFIVAIATDGIDGWIARTHDIVTDLGKLLDPIADKVLTGGALVGLSILGELPWWVTIVVAGARGRHHRLRLVGCAATTSCPRRPAASSRPSCRRSRSRSRSLPLWTLVGDWIYWVNGVADDDRRGAHGRERHRLRRDAVRLARAPARSGDGERMPRAADGPRRRRDPRAAALVRRLTDAAGRSPSPSR